jgi:hypothetical protein
MKIRYYENGKFVREELLPDLKPSIEDRLSVLEKKMEETDDAKRS